jgi:hypothetical protein
MNRRFDKPKEHLGEGGKYEKAGKRIKDNENEERKKQNLVKAFHDRG